MEFGTCWRRWIATILSTATSKILLNGQPGPTIKYRRVRQGDSLSPLLIILAMEVLNRLFRTAREQGILRSSSSREGIKYQCSIYADDVILFAHPNAPEAEAVKALLQIFEDASGLRTNMSKCSITNIYGAESSISSVQQVLRCQIAPFPIRYLGLPLSTTKVPKDHIRKTVDAVARRLPSCHGALMAKSDRFWSGSNQSYTPYQFTP